MEFLSVSIIYVPTITKRETQNTQICRYALNYQCYNCIYLSIFFSAVFLTAKLYSEEYLNVSATPSEIKRE
jgi:hypothetical protein